MGNKNKIRIAFGIVILSMLVGLILGSGMTGLLSLSSNAKQHTLSITVMGISTLFMAVPVIVYYQLGKCLWERLKIEIGFPLVVIRVLPALWPASHGWYDGNISQGLLPAGGLCGKHQQRYSAANNRHLISRFDTCVICV